jgi:hypothetical protein
MIKILKSVDFLKKVLGQHGGPYALVPVGEQLKRKFPLAVLQSLLFTHNKRNLEIKKLDSLPLVFLLYFFSLHFRNCLLELVTKLPRSSNNLKH